MDETLLKRLEQLLTRVEAILPPTAPATDWDAIAWRWTNTGSGYLEAIDTPHHITLDELLDIDRQKHLAVNNTRQFVEGQPANNVLLWGARGTGKSSLIKALLHEFQEQGLRVIEVDKHQLVELPTIVKQLKGRPERFIMFCDDLSFEAEDAGYKALKAILDGTLASPPDNVLVYATSNRRHLLPEFMEENHMATMVKGEIHHADVVEEKISLSERFGLWLAFHPFNQDQYLSIVSCWLAEYGIDEMSDDCRTKALRWAMHKGSRSGRVASQFARHWAGQIASGNFAE